MKSQAMSAVADSLIVMPMAHPFEKPSENSRIPKVAAKDKGPGNAWINGDLPARQGRPYGSSISLSQ